MKRTLLLLQVVSVLAAAGCDGGILDFAAGGFVVRSERARYTVERVENGFRVDLAFRLANIGDVPVHGSNCGGVMDLELQKRVGDRWERAWRPYLPLCLSQPLVIRPGRTHRHVAEVIAFLPGTAGGPELETDALEGTFRVVFQALRVAPEAAGDSRDTGLPKESRTSDPFVLELR